MARSTAADHGCRPGSHYENNGFKGLELHYPNLWDSSNNTSSSALDASIQRSVDDRQHLTSHIQVRTFLIWDTPRNRFEMFYPVYIIPA